MATGQSETVNDVPQGCNRAEDTYSEIRNDLDGLMGEVGSASLLACHLATAMDNDEDTDRALQGALYSLQNLLEAFRQQGDAMVHRMMALERPAARAAGKAVRS